MIFAEWVALSSLRFVEVIFRAFACWFYSFLALSFLSFQDITSSPRNATVPASMCGRALVHFFFATFTCILSPSSYGLLSVGLTHFVPAE